MNVTILYGYHKIAQLHPKTITEKIPVDHFLVI